MLFLSLLLLVTPVTMIPIKKLPKASTVPSLTLPSVQADTAEGKRTRKIERTARGTALFLLYPSSQGAGGVEFREEEFESLPQ
jgi:hypothetical protein